MLTGKIPPSSCPLLLCGRVRPAARLSLISAVLACGDRTNENHVEEKVLLPHDFIRFFIIFCVQKPSTKY